MLKRLLQKLIFKLRAWFLNPYHSPSLDIFTPMEGIGRGFTEGVAWAEKEMKGTAMFRHEWKFDLPWHMVNLRDWFYMVNTGFIFGEYYLHVRILGIRSLWIIQSDSDHQSEKKTMMNYDEIEDQDIGISMFCDGIEFSSVGLGDTEAIFKSIGWKPFSFLRRLWWKIFPPEFRWIHRQVIGECPGKDNIYLEFWSGYRKNQKTPSIEEEMDNFIKYLHTVTIAHTTVEIPARPAKTYDPSQYKYHEYGASNES